MPWSTVKNLVLLVITLVIVVVILLKVPGLADKIFDWFGKLFGATGKTEGKALHIRLDARNGWLDPFEVYEFHLTDFEENQHIAVYGGGDMKGSFYLDTSSELFASNCVILTSLEGESLKPDHAFIYYVSPGSVVQEGCDNLEGCVNVIEKNCSVAYNYFEDGKVNPDDCYCYCDWEMCERGTHPECPSSCWPGGAFIRDLSCEHPFGYVVASSTASCSIYDAEVDRFRQCDFSESVFKKEFETVEDTKDKCEGSSLCNLLVTEGGKHAYMVKYGLLCDDKGTWQACTKEKTENSAISIGDEKYMCCPDGDVFVWKLGDAC